MMGKDAAPRKSKWGLGIFGLYAGFVLLMLVLVIVSVRQNFDLVEADYYEQGLAYQNRIEQASRAARLSRPVTTALNAGGDSIVVSFPDECATDTILSQVWLYRPSNARWDRHHEQQPVAEARQSLPLEYPVPGLWKTRVEWRWRDSLYFSEGSFYLAP